MAKYTVLELVQKVLDSVNSDEVNSIGDTIESLKVANVLEDVFFNLITNKHIPETEGLLKLDSLSDVNYPNYLRLPSRVNRIISVRYDKAETSDDAPQYREIVYLCPEDFLMKMTHRIPTDDNIQIVNDINTGVRLLVYNDRHPHYWTSFDDEYMVFDSYLNTMDSTLQNSKTMVVARRIPEFRKEDSFTPDIDDNLFPLLLNEVKAWAHVELNQQSHPKAEQNARKQTTFYQAERHRFRDAEKNPGPDYGR